MFTCPQTSAKIARVCQISQSRAPIRGCNTNGMGTYTSEARPDGSLYGEGQGAMITADGEAITWKGSGAGKILAGGALSYRGILYYRTNSQKLSRLNNACGVFEYEVDPTGNTTAKVWEWK
jgi:hypothetical protein